MNVLNSVITRFSVHFHWVFGFVAIVVILTSSLFPAQKAMAQALLFQEAFTPAVATQTIVFPIASSRKAPRRLIIDVTAYNSLPEQTDDTPFETADGTRVRDGIVATNFLPLGTRVKFPELYGEKEFVVKDRMNARYWKRADIWMEHKHEALILGKRFTPIEIY